MCQCCMFWTVSTLNSTSNTQPITCVDIVEQSLLFSSVMEQHDRQQSLLITEGSLSASYPEINVALCPAASMVQANGRVLVSLKRPIDRINPILHEIFVCFGKMSATKKTIVCRKRGRMCGLQHKVFCFIN